VKNVWCTTNSMQDDDTQTCDECTQLKEHIERARVSRKWYQDDVARTKEADEVIFSVDMQKVIMMPRMAGVKSCVFTRRLIVFHETFAPSGKKGRCGTSKQPVYSIVWHEGISGRNADDVASAYIKVIRAFRDQKIFLFYADNCAAQNKNWCLFTALAAEVNRE